MATFKEVAERYRKEADALDLERAGLAQTEENIEKYRSLAQRAKFLRETAADLEKETEPPPAA